MGPTWEIVVKPQSKILKFTFTSRWIVSNCQREVSLPGEGSLILFSGHLGPHDLPLTVQKLERRRRERQRREERSEKRFEAFLYSGHLLLQLDNGNVHYRLPSHRRFTAILQNRLQPGDPVGKRTQPLQLIKHLGLPVSRLLGILRRLIVVGNC